MSWRPVLWVAVCVVMTAMIAVADYELWRRELSSSVFYLVPIVIAAWLAGSRGGVLVAAVATACWQAVELLRHTYLYPAAPYWNSGVRLVFFVVCALFVSRTLTSLERQRAEADTDALTGVPNNRRFYELLEEEIDRSGRTGRAFTVAFLDLDKFKEVNDQQGHVVGDTLLREIATHLRRGIRGTDVFARLGGDEFGFILSETDEGGAAVCLARVRRGLVGLMEDGGWPVRCSIGAVTVHEVPEDRMEIVRAADQLMYRAKRAANGMVEIGALDRVSASAGG